MISSRRHRPVATVVPLRRATCCASCGVAVTGPAGICDRCAAWSRIADYLRRARELLRGVS
jgi:antitoxin (DNA-binding transcriptional repressor) of toxin-antitoxin stability system